VALLTWDTGLGRENFPVGEQLKPPPSEEALVGTVIFFPWKNEQLEFMAHRFVNL
jgi:hypothetical protein